MSTKKTTNKTTTKKATAKKATVKKAAPVKVSKKPAAKGTAKKATGGAGNVLRVRMYRVGFGDFFLLTVPTDSGPAHILIDCGVHAGDIGTMRACFENLAQVTERKLALVIATHYHADHLSGFASNYDDFAEFEVGMVWISNRLDPGKKEAAKFHAQITSLAEQLRLKLGMRLAALGVDDDDDDDGRAHLDSQQAMWMMQDALGIQLGAGGGGGNAKALQLLTEGFKNKPPVRYYQGGDTPELPDQLKGFVTAELLGPAPMDSGGLFSGTDNRKEQYLAAAAEGEFPETEGFKPFEKDWPATSADYHPDAFSEYRTEEQVKAKQPGTPANLEAVLHGAQPDALLAMAEAVDGTLNNQSLVVLFTCQEKRLLFVGDAQWGNWSYWLYGKKVTGADPGITEKARSILGSIDFFKVGHHGSTNANPIPAVKAINPNCASMCSTESGEHPAPPNKRPYGNPDKGTEVPRTKLMEALEQQTGNRLVRSDFIPAGGVPPSTDAREELPALPPNFEQGDLYVDYIFPSQPARGGARPRRTNPRRTR